MRTRAVGISLAVVGTGVLFFSAFRYREDFRLLWYRRQAARECQPGTDGRASAWSALREAGLNGYPHLAILLDDPDPKVSNLSSQWIDELWPHDEVVSYLREKDPRAMVRHLLLLPGRR